MLIAYGYPATNKNWNPAPCYVTIPTVEAALCKFQLGLLDETGGAGTLLTHDGHELHGQALVGKTVRGASVHGELIHLVHHDSSLVLDQDKATNKLRERPHEMGRQGVYKQCQSSTMGCCGASSVLRSMRWAMRCAIALMRCGRRVCGTINPNSG